MIKHVWSVFCSKDIINSVTNNITLVEIIERLQVQGRPSTESDSVFLGPINGVLVTLWSLIDLSTPSKGVAKVVFYDASGKEHGAFPQEVDLTTYHRTRLRTVVPTIPVSGSGNHVWSILVKDPDTDDFREVARVPIEVSVELDQLESEREEEA